MFNWGSSSAPPKMDVQTRRNLLLLYDVFPNVERPVIDTVFEQCKYDMDRVSETLLGMSPPTNPRHTHPANPTIRNLGNWNLPQMHNRPDVQPPIQMPVNRTQLPNEYVHKFEMKQGDFLPSTSNKSTRYDQIYVNQPYMMRSSQNVTDDKDIIPQHSDLLSLPNDAPESAEAKGSATVEELRKEIEENKQMMSKIMDFIQNRLQAKEVEDVAAKAETKVVPPTEDEVEMLNQMKKKSDLKKLLRLQQDIDKKLEENKESVINMLDNFKLEMQNMLADKIKTLTEGDKDEENEETARADVEDPPLNDDEKPGCSSSKTDNETEYPFTQKTPDLKGIMPCIQEGCKVLLLMRGLPGSGKTTLASSILYRGVGKVHKEKFIFSTNDYMKKIAFPIGGDADDKIKQALLRNQRRCYEAMKVGVSPIIIDDNNLEIHEMRLYCTLATMFGYIIEIVEPQTPWALKPEILAQRNTTGVNEIEIQEMLKRFQQNITVNDLRQEFKLTYKEDIPQFRKYPPIPTSK